MTTLPSITICDQGHTSNYPVDLEDLANQSGDIFGFCAACPCGTVALALAWPDKGVRVWETGDTTLFEDFEATGWPEIVHGHPQHGSFFIRKVPALGPVLFSSRNEDRAQFEQMCREGW